MNETCDRCGPAVHAAYLVDWTGYPERHRGCQDQQSSGVDSRHFDQ